MPKSTEFDMLPDAIIKRLPGTFDYLVMMGHTILLTFLEHQVERLIIFCSTSTSTYKAKKKRYVCSRLVVILTSGYVGNLFI